MGKNTPQFKHAKDTRPKYRFDFTGRELDAQGTRTVDSTILVRSNVPIHTRLTIGQQCELYFGEGFDKYRAVVQQKKSPTSYHVKITEVYAANDSREQVIPDTRILS